jgi:phosphate transport system substrate-binding protein
MRYLACLLSVVIAVPLLAQGVPDLLEQTRRIDEQIRQLAAQTPAVRAMRQIGNREQEIREERSALERTPEWKAYQTRLAELQRRRSEIAEAGRRQIADAARQIYETRHRQLRQSGRADLNEARRLGLDVLSYPRVDGSTSTYPLGVIMAARLLQVPYEWEYLETRGWLPFNPSPGNRILRPDPHSTSHTDSLIWRAAADRTELQLAASRVFADPGRGEDARQSRIARMINSVLAAHTNTHQAYVNLIDGRCDLNLTARKPSESERRMAEAKGVQIVTVPVALDALVFLVNVENPVENLTRQQLKQIYRAEIGNWSRVGGADTGIRALRRARDSGSRELFDELLMQGEQLGEPKDALASDLYDTMGMMGPFSRITQYPDALGYSIHYYEHYMAMSPRTRALSIDGVSPNAETIASGRYPFATQVHAAYREDAPVDGATRKLVQWLLSEEGQAVVAESGYVPVRSGGR